MKILSLFLLLQIIWYAPAQSQTTPTRQKININRDWKFELGDHAEAMKPFYNDHAWHNISLPHNFSIPYFQDAQWYTGYGWYRKYFDVPMGWKSKRVFIEFEAAFREAEVFVNGVKAGSHQGGYTGFTFDITDKIKTGKNVLAVRLNNNYNSHLAPRNGDHNFTGGIYRDVYLVVTNPVYVTWYGSWVTTPALSKASGTVNIKTEVRNSGIKAKVYTIKTDIIDPIGKIVSTISSAGRIGPNTTFTFDQTTNPIKEPKLWHPQHPYLYKAVNHIMDGKKVVDQYETKFGFRWMKWTVDSGFFLNGEHYYFRGANVHQDHAGWASAVTDAGIKRDVQMIKDCGMDFIRGSHYPHAPAFSEACDSLGILLWEENDFWGSGGTQRETDNWYDGAGAYPMNAEDQAPFEASVKSDLREMIRIHRNHPSIIVWSMCNEPFFTDQSTITKVRGFLKELTEMTHKLDPTRSVGIGGSQRGDLDKLADIAGYNGDGARLFLNPAVPNVVTEYGSTIGIRPGKYIPGWGDLQQEKFPWRSGEALWCGFDYGTRAGEFGKMGMIDYFRLSKNMYYWYRNEYKHIAPPTVPENGIPAKLHIAANKTKIIGTNGTDDIMLVVSVLDKNEKQLSNSPDVQLRIISGPGEFPTGSKIVFSNNSDIYIRDGKAAIEFRSYYGGKTVIEATSTGLESSKITIETIGTPIYIEGKTPKVEERLYKPYIKQKPASADMSGINIAYQKPTRASSEVAQNSANNANDHDTSTMWQGNMTDTIKWWQVDLENLYTVSEIKLYLLNGDVSPYQIEISKDNQNWKTIVAVPKDSTNKEKERIYKIENVTPARFFRVTFTNAANKPVALNEVEVFGNPVN